MRGHLGSYHVFKLTHVLNPKVSGKLFEPLISELLGFRLLSDPRRGIARINFREWFRLLNLTSFYPLSFEEIFSPFVGYLGIQWLLTLALRLQLP